MIRFFVYYYICVILIISKTECVSGARILAAYPTLSRSHYIVAEALLKELASRGHNVIKLKK